MNQKGKVALVVEDDITLCLLTKMQLTKLGYDVHIARNGIQAVDAACSQDYDLIFMDLHLPEMDGFEATLKIRDHEKQNGRPPKPIIALTASHEREQALATGVSDFLLKPVLLKDLAQITRKWQSS